MIIALDTSVRRRVLAVRVTDDGNVDAVVRSDGRAHSALIIDALRELGCADADAMVVGMGPGSYTGVRTGIAAAFGVAHASDIPLFGISSLAFLAAALTTDEPVSAVSGAGRGGIFALRLHRDTAASTGSWQETAPPERLDIATVTADGNTTTHYIGADPIAGLDVEIVDTAKALGVAAQHALTTMPLTPATLAAIHIADPHFARVAQRAPT